VSGAPGSDATHPTFNPSWEDCPDELNSPTAVALSPTSLGPRGLARPQAHEIAKGLLNELGTKTGEFCVRN
jgi:hypothetical protein